MAADDIGTDAKPAIYSGESGDAKPTPTDSFSGDYRIGSLFYEVDTGNVYRYMDDAGGTGGWYLIESAGAQLSSDPMLDAASGNVPGKASINKFGFAPDFDTTDGEVTVWDGADDAGSAKMVYTYSSTADITDIVSSSTSDNGLTIEVQGLDTNWNLVTQSKALGSPATTSVALDTALKRVFRMKNTSGTELTGTVQCGVGSTTTSFSSANLRAQIGVGNEQTLMAIYTVPANKTAYVTGWYAYAAGANKAADFIITLQARSENGVFQVKHLSVFKDSVISGIEHKYAPYNKFTEKTDLEMRVKIDTGGTTAAGISAGFDIILVDN